MTEKGTVLDGKYEILKEIGRGGMSIVYVAMDLRLNKQWAIKEIKDDGSQDTQTLLKGLEREANILKKVDHPVLPRIVDIIQKDKKVYVVMDYVEGHPLNKILAEEGAQPQELVIQWAKDLASALDYLHSMNPPIIYRDMKPSNVMLKSDGKVKLIDFGTAKEYKVENNADTTALGTRGYAAPEQFGDRQGRGLYNTDARTDIYCLGATLYHIVTGMNPCEPPYQIEPIRKWNPALSSGLEKILLKCTQPNPNDRYQSCSELLYALDHYDELDDQFRKQLKHKFGAFVGVTAAALVFSVVSVAGFAGQKNISNQNYESIITSAADYRRAGNYDEAVAEYKRAIEFNSKNENAYIDLMELYVDYMGETEQGLDTTAAYVNGNKNLAKNDRLLFELGVAYFNESYYEASLKYFRMINKSSKEYSESAQHYIAIAECLSELNINYDELSDNLKAFESDIAKNRNNSPKEKLMNYQNLAQVYSVYINSVEGADESIARILEPALEDLEKYKNDKSIENTSGYSFHYNLYLALAYQSMASKTEGEVAETYYYRSLECSENAMAQTSQAEDFATYEELYVIKANAYAELGKEQEAIQTYEEAEEQLGTTSATIYINHLRYLYNKYKAKNPDVASWKAPDIIEVYNKGSQVPGIADNFEWKPLVNNLQPILSKQSSPANEPVDDNSETNENESGDDATTEVNE